MLALVLASCLTACAVPRQTFVTSSAANLPDWPRITSAIPKSPAVEAEVARILAGMTLAQKIGQMTQPEIKSVTPDQVRDYYIGSVLNGGSYWPNGNKLSALSDWVRLADQYYDASMATDMAVKVPVIWGTDAIHGHGNAYGASLFPHNIGLGAAHDVALIRDIGVVVARQVRASGINWVFGPTLAVARDVRWGRTYESFSEDGNLVHDYAQAYVSGMQGRLGDDGNALATAKHFIGDGATERGQDQGVSTVTLAEMMAVHGQGYYGALTAGVQAVMASFSSWNDVAAGLDYGKLHGSKTLLTDVLKEKMGFDGFVVTDWNGIDQLPGCSQSRCAQAINAGIDMVMVPDNWRAFIENTMQQVQAGEIARSRIDDAVSRILRVKLRAGMFGKRPSAGAYAGKTQALQARELARQAVRQSLVLLKNNKAVLPLSRSRRVLVVGKSADSLQNQTGGWTLGWQGTHNNNSYFPIGDTILAGIREAVGSASVVFSESAQGLDVSGFDAVIAVIGETPYAEGHGDIAAPGTLRHSSRYPEDLALLQAVAGHGKPVITVLVTGRPVFANDLLNLSDAFVVAWLPGTEGKGLADVLLRDASGAIDHDFTGRLSFSWPSAACATAPNFGTPLFARGYGLDYATQTQVALLDAAVAPDDCGQARRVDIFKQSDRAPYALQVASAASNGRSQPVGPDLNATLEWPAEHAVIRVQTTQITTQQDAKLVRWLGGPARFFAASAGARDLRPHALAHAALQFDIVIERPPEGPVSLTLACGEACQGEVEIGDLLRALPQQTLRTVKIALACFARKGLDFSSVTSPFGVLTSAPFAAAFANIAWVVDEAPDAAVLTCPEPGANSKLGRPVQ